MSNLKNKIKIYLGREPDFLKEVVLFDHSQGEGAYIRYWSDTLEKPKPTDEQLAEIE